ncbi:ASCH domain-containing protein [Pyrococcus kukulkanii]|uniref:Hydrothetical protein n=1 Tax=Pyrococcus kukulkanii TaxID=1609559 RepID=A0A127BB00_9EURY|nr:ASCH domain-containing protein [Pyrococcus kukulkanii]AMM54520.1 hydrothetical protein [Pyrococcus kukulkanii]
MKTVQIRKFILLDNKYKAKIISGKKVTTVRYGKYEAKPGSEVYIVITPSDTAIAKARIKEVRTKKVKELTNEDAKLDGFSDVRELVRELSKIYGELYGDDEVTIIEFEDVRPLKEGIPLKWLKGLNYRDPYEIVEVALNNFSDLSLTQDIEIILKRIKERGLREAAKNFGPKRVQQALLKAYHVLYDKGLI